MKSIEKILEVIREWPEGVRRLAAVLVMAIITVMVFSGFSRGLSSRLTALSLNPAQQITEELKNRGTEEPKNQVLSPAAGLGESFKSLEEFAKGVSFKLPSADHLKKQGNDVLQSLAGIWNAVAEKVWRWIYLP